MAVSGMARAAFSREHGDGHQPYKMKTPSESAAAVAPEKTSRASFSSVREDDGGLAQTFTKSPISCFSPKPDEAVDDSASTDDDMADAAFLPPLTQPFSRLHGAWHPAHSFRGWKQISVQGKTKTKSFGDLHALNLSWASPPRCRTSKSSSQNYAPGASPLEALPIEVLGLIIELLAVETPPNGITTRNTDLMALLLTSRTVHAATLDTLYRHITIPHSRIYKKFLDTIKLYPALGTIVRRLDLSHFNPGSLFLTACERRQAQNLTAQTLLDCFALTPNLRDFLAQEHVEDDLSADVLGALFWGLPGIRAIDLCGCSSATFREAFVLALRRDPPDCLPVKRLSLHKCLTLPSFAFEVLLPRLGNITHLDLAGTKVTDAALASIPATARITHLNLAKCTLLTASKVIKFLSEHPAVRSSLVYLSVAADATSHQLLDVMDVSRLVPALPRTLRSLSLKGSKMASQHIEILRPLLQHLEELALGRCLSVADLSRLFPDPDFDSESNAPSSLRYLDLSDLAANDVDLISLFSDSSLLKPASAPLEVIEVADSIYRRVARSPQALNRVGWTAKEFECRAWLVRNSVRKIGEDGQRWWKMGAESWGMRKIPVARAEVGGMYGAFMFGRKL